MTHANTANRSLPGERNRSPDCYAGD